MDNFHPYAYLVKVLGSYQQARQEELEAEERELLNAEYAAALAKLAEEQKELDVQCAAANQKLANAMEWSVEQKVLTKTTKSRCVMLSMFLLCRFSYQKGSSVTMSESQSS